MGALTVLTLLTGALQLTATRGARTQGCAENPALGFKYLQMAAESVARDIDTLIASRARAGATPPTRDELSGRSELVLALREIGTSYRFGWGVDKDKKAVGRSVLCSFSLSC